MTKRLTDEQLRWRGWLLLGSALIASVAVLLRGPIHQDLGYHAFADGRTMGGLPNALNVLSNVPFAVVGAAGLRVVLGGLPFYDDARERLPFLVLFGGILLTAFGSAYYHWAPSSETLFWDRLPMTLGFMSLFSLVVKERVDERIGTLLAGPLVLVGLASVLYWRLGDGSGRGDLRLYVLVQFYPLIAMPLLLTLFPARYAGTRLLVWALVWYAAAKALEVADARIYALFGGLVSGHSLKHLAAATATYFLVRMARARAASPEPA